MTSILYLQQGENLHRLHYYDSIRSDSELTGVEHIFIISAA